MSWSTKAIGSKAKISETVAAKLDSAAEHYKTGNPEEYKDIMCAKERILAALEGFDVTADQYSNGAEYGVIVEASGSRGAGWFNMSMKIEKTLLCV